MSYFSAVKYTIAEPTTDPVLTIPFPYIDLLDLRVIKEVPPVPPDTEITYDYISYGPGEAGAWELLSSTQVRINASFLPGDVIWVRRFTRRDQRLAEYFDGSTLTEEDLNSVTLQLLYLIQEIMDTVGLGGSPVGGAPGGPGDPGPGGGGPSIQDIIDALLQSQLFQDLIALIDLTNINAEAIMANTLAIHDRWSQAQVFGHLLDSLDEGLEAIDARVTIAEQTIIDNDSATAGLLLAVQARMDEAESDLIQLFTATAATDHALTQFIQVAESRFDANEARIGTVETTYASQTYVQAQIVTQLDTRFAPANFNGYLNASSVIQGLQATNSAQGSSVSGITSYIAGSGVTTNPDGSINWPATYAGAAPGSLARSLSTVQTTVDAHATQLLTEAAFRTALASAFSPGNASNVGPLIAGIEQAWRTYADEDSATASLATTLAVNRQPIIFQATAPDPYNDPEWGNPTAAGYRINGFPNGSIWYRKVGTTLTPYWWDATRTTVPDPAPHSWYGPFAVLGNTKPGMWLPSRDTNLEDVLGARIDNYANTSIFEDRVEAMFQTQLTTVFDAVDFSAVNTIAERLVSYIDETTGTMYSSWNVRINQYMEHPTTGEPIPAIAGVGLGMQTDLLNPENGAVSSFIVMANQFAIINPPTLPVDPLTDPLDLDTVQVPFVVDAASNRVIINGTLLARSFRSLEAYIGRLTVTQMDLETFQPLDPNGQRLILPSNTGAGNVGVGLSPFTGAEQRFLIWAGEGDMGHNNAIFYVDTDGNARFTGEVVGDNLVGTVNDTVVVAEVLPTVVTAASTTTWTLLGPVHVLPGIGSIKTRTPTAIIAMAIFGVGSQVGKARMEMRTTQVGQPHSEWTSVAECTQYTGAGSTLTLAGSLPTKVAGPVEMRISLQRFNSGDPCQTNRYNGIFMGVR